MTEKKFTELVNLYLDKEISESGLSELKSELAENAIRKAEFQERCRLHQAMRLAMNPSAATSCHESKRSGRNGSRRIRTTPSHPPGSRDSGSRRTVRAASRVPACSRFDPHEKEHIAFPRWILGSGLAACFVLGLVLLPPVFRDTTSVASLPALEGVEADELVEEDPLDNIGRAELRRFALMQEQPASNRRASLAAQLRLMGLRPELIPEHKQLRPVSLLATQLAPVRSHASLLDEVQKMTPMPNQRILRAESLSPAPAGAWPGGFQSSLASFK